MEEMKDISMAGLRSMFYMVTPNESSFQHVEEVPKYTSQASPFFITLILLELVVGWIKTGKPIASISDGITSIFAGIISRLPSLFMRGLELTTYIFVWNHFRMVVLPWDSPWTWWLAFLAVDFGYYWVHRSSHGSRTCEESAHIIFFCRKQLFLSYIQLLWYCADVELCPQSSVREGGSYVPLPLHGRLVIMEHCGVPDNGFVPGGRKELAVDEPELTREAGLRPSRLGSPPSGLRRASVLEKADGGAGGAPGGL
ncbi:unnamed protein product [Arctogadus glacialis]